MNSVLAFLALALVLATATLATAQDFNFDSMGGLKGMDQNEMPVDPSYTVLAKAVAGAKASPKDPDAFMSIFYAMSSLLSNMLAASPDWSLFDQHDGFFYVATLLPQQYQLNYVKRV